MKFPLDTILRLTAARFDVTVQEIRARSRKKPIVRARMAAMYVAHQQLNLSYAALGRLFGHVDHTSALYLVRRVPDLLGEEPDFQQQLINLLTDVIAANIAHDEMMRGGVFKSCRAKGVTETTKPGML